MKICHLTSFHQTLKPRISEPNSLHNVRVWYPVDTGNPVVSSATFLVHWTVRLQVPLAENNDPLTWTVWIIRFRILLFLRETDMVNRHWRERHIDDCHVGLLRLDTVDIANGCMSC